VLRDVSFTVRAGERVALVGPTGAGKTTLLNLLMRLYDPQQGRITLGGRDLREVTVESLRAQMGIVLQDSFLFAGSVRDNIRYGRLDATQEEIEAAARAVHAHDFIVQLSEGYDTDVRERGVRLSVGQRQLLSFARALLANPRILLLDEATANVDTATEVQIQAALHRLFHGRTALVIAHRLSTVVDADHILVIDEGRIVERGVHADLLARGGLYRRLYEMQFRDEESA
jgi:ATP-binding cassette subfamily B protein